MNNEEQCQDFEKLQHLLKLKRYEQPPPRYFNDFSGHVLSAIRADRSNARFESVREFISRTPWLRRLWRKFEHQPALAGGLATVACGLMVAGVFLTGGTTPEKPDFMAVGGGASAGNGGSPAATPGLGNNFAAATATPQLVSSTNMSPLPTGPNLFQNLRPLEVMPASGAPLLQK